MGPLRYERPSMLYWMFFFCVLLFSTSHICVPAEKCFSEPNSLPYLYNVIFIAFKITRSLVCYLLHFFSCNMDFW